MEGMRLAQRGLSLVREESTRDLVRMVAQNSRGHVGGCSRTLHALEAGSGPRGVL